MKPLGYKLIKACAECGADMILKTGKYGLFYSCVEYPNCDGCHGAHQQGKLKGEPLGIPATKETKAWRIRAHDAFDKLWKEWGYKRKEAYGLLQNMMGMTPEQAHIGKFNIDQCKTLIKKIKI